MWIAGERDLCEYVEMCEWNNFFENGNWTDQSKYWSLNAAIDYDFVVYANLFIYRAQLIHLQSNLTILNKSHTFFSL